MDFVKETQDADLEGLTLTKLKMRIGIDGRLAQQTGVGRYIRNLFFWLKKIDRENDYLFLQPKIQWHSFREQLFFPLWLAFQKVDLVHFPYFSFPIFCPQKFIVTIHDLIPWHFKTGKASTLPVLLYKIKHFFYKLVLFLGARRAYKIITVSATTKNEIIKHLKVNPDKIVVIYEGVEPKFKIQNSKFKNTIKNLKLKNYLLYVGNAYPHKNLERLIEGFKDIRAKSYKLKATSLKLVLVGPNDYFYQRLQNFIKNQNLLGEVIFYGPAQDSELFVLYRKAIAFVSPSLMEGFGLPGLEAMASGCPVICSDIRAFREVYEKVAIYFNPLNKEEISQKILKVVSMDSEERKALIKKGKQQVKMYSWDECARKTLKVYES